MVGGTLEMRAQGDVRSTRSAYHAGCRECHPTTNKRTSFRSEQSDSLGDKQESNQSERGSCFRVGAGLNPGAGRRA